MAGKHPKTDAARIEVVNDVDEMAQVAPNRSSFETVRVTPQRKAFKAASSPGPASRRRCSCRESTSGSSPQMTRRPSLRGTFPVAWRGVKSDRHLDFAPRTSRVDIEALAARYNDPGINSLDAMIGLNTIY
jgi:hypothetical protein